MRITGLKTNHIINPLGYELSKPSLSYVVTDTKAKKQMAARIVISLDEEFGQVVLDTGKSEKISSLGFEVKKTLEPRTRYYWRAEVWGDNGESALSETAWFETAKMEEEWAGTFITPNMDQEIQPVLMKEFQVEKEIKRARMYISGLGLYEAYINQNKAGDEYLTPGCNNYDRWIQYQTYDILEYIKEGKNEIKVAMGDGWFKGSYGRCLKPDYARYGSEMALICEIRLEYQDGREQVIGTDTSWKAQKGKVLSSDIYDGEIYDAGLEDDKIYSVSENGDFLTEKLTARYGVPVKVKQTVRPKKLIITPKGETVLDMGQNMVGWLAFWCREPKGSRILLQYGEILQDDNFYRDNLRSAKAEYLYISDGNCSFVRPHFTFFGFRYVKITGVEKINIEDFVGEVIYSDLEETGVIKTDNPLVNKLFENTLWGQRGNFVDIPTDCPQRDERLGWTGDAQIFSGTACFNMDAYPFFRKYGHDLYSEQKELDGKVPVIIPALHYHDMRSTAWGEAATVIPWNLYLHYGNKAILEEQFESMKGWVDFMRKEDIESGDRKLWTTGFHYGDWLALDGGFDNMPTGGTEVAYIASSYYSYSAGLVAKAAKVLGREEEAKKYGCLSEQIKEAVREEYFSPKGRLTIDTQTAYVVALYMDIVKEEWKERFVKDMRKRFEKDDNYLKTGFVGTPYLGRVLSGNGCNDIAYTLLMNDKFPSWLYEISMGATTIWERWNSVLPDGKISSTGMNSLNHYAYGSVVEWMYRDMAGINPVEDNPGFKRAVLAPKPDQRLGNVMADVNTASGRYRSGWRLIDNQRVIFYFEVPFDAEADVFLPKVTKNGMLINGKAADIGKEDESGVAFELGAGKWEILCHVKEGFYHYYSTYDCIHELYKSDEAKKVLLEIVPGIEKLMSDIYVQSVRELSVNPTYLGVGPVPITEEILNELDQRLGKILKNL